MLSNRTVKTAIRLAPIIGRQPSLIHHVEQAILKSKNYDGFINNIKKITKNAKHDTFEPERKKELAKLSKQMKELTLDKQIANLLRLAKEKEIKDNELIKKLLEQLKGGLKKQTAKESIKNTINNK